MVIVVSNSSNISCIENSIKIITGIYDSNSNNSDNSIHISLSLVVSVSSNSGNSSK